MALYSREWRRQPFRPRLDPGDPLWNGIQAAYYFNAGAGHLVDSSLLGRFGAPATNGLQFPSSLGVAWAGTRGRGAISTNPYSAVGGGVPISYSVWATPDGADTTIDCLLQTGHESTAPREHLSLYLNVVSAGDVYVGTSARDFYTAGGRFAALSPVHIVVTYAGGEINTNSVIYVNGVAQALTLVGNSAGSLFLKDGYPIRIATQTNANREFRGKIHTAHVWSRALTQGDVLRLYRNPWAGMSRRIWVAQPGAPVLPTLSLPTYTPGSLTATGFRPRVTAG